MAEAGIGISAVVAIGSKFIERSKFAARHDVIYDKEAEKIVRLADRFDEIDKEDVDQFEFQEYTMLHSKSLQDLGDYRRVQEEYKEKEWHREPAKKFRSRKTVREAKRMLQSSIAREAQHVDELETYSRSASSCSTRSVSGVTSDSSGLDLTRDRPYRTDSCSIRATGGSPPWSSMEDICEDERKDRIVSNVSNWLSEIESTPFEEAPGLISHFDDHSLGQRPATPLEVDIRIKALFSQNSSTSLSSSQLEGMGGETENGNGLTNRFYTAPSAQLHNSLEKTPTAQLLSSLEQTPTAQLLSSLEETSEAQLLSSLEKTPAAPLLTSFNPTVQLLSLEETMNDSLLSAVNAFVREWELVHSSTTCRNYTCCSVLLADLGALLKHFEEVHVIVLNTTLTQSRAHIYIPFNPTIQEYTKPQGYDADATLRAFTTLRAFATLRAFLPRVHE